MVGHPSSIPNMEYVVAFGSVPLNSVISDSDILIVIRLIDAMSELMLGDNSCVKKWATSPKSSVLNTVMSSGAAPTYSSGHPLSLSGHLMGPCSSPFSSLLLILKQFSEQECPLEYYIL